MADENSDINKVDGIKRLSDEERQKSREIILETIGEQSHTEAKAEKIEIKSVMPNISKRIDSVLHFADKIQEKKQAETFKIDQKKKEEWRQEVSKILPVTNDIKVGGVKNNAAPNLLMQAPTKTEFPAKEKAIKTELSSTKKEKDYPKEVKRQKTIVRKTALKKEPKDKKKTLHFSPSADYVKPLSKQNLSIKKIFGLNEKNKAAWHRLEQRANIVVRKALLYFFIFLSATLVSYSVLVFVIVKLKLDNPVLRSVSDYILIPAIITKDGPIDFYSYQDIKSNLKLTDQETEQEIIKNIILSNLYQKFKLPDNGLTGLDELKKDVAYDGDINQAPLERIKKIKELIKNDKDFIGVSAKYGDESGRISINKDNSSQYNFYDNVKQLKSDAISDIVYTSEGYYIFKNTSQNQETLDLNYVFVRTKNLNSYLEETIKNYKYYSLVN